MTDQLSITLGAVQLVCHLVTLSNTTNSVPAVTKTPSQYQATNELPCGYFAHPSIGVAWKYHYKVESLLSAMNVCRKEGAQLAVIDSIEKVHVIDGLRPPRMYIHGGVIRLDSTEWVNVNTGLTISSPPWMSRWPIEFGSRDTRNCGHYFPLVGYEGMTNSFNCEHGLQFICEVPIPSRYESHATQWFNISLQ